MPPDTASRRGPALGLAVSVGLGALVLAYHAAGGPGADFARTRLGGLCYVVAGVFAVLTAAPRSAPGRVALAVLAFTCAVELAQLWQPPWLQAVRATAPGRLVLGTTFAVSDFPFYGAGAAVGYGVARWLRGRA